MLQVKDQWQHLTILLLLCEIRFLPFLLLFFMIAVQHLHIALLLPRDACRT